MSTTDEPGRAVDAFRPLDDDERALWFDWKRAHEVVRTSVAEAVTAATGLSDPEVMILIRLANAGGSLRQNTLTAGMGWDRTRLSHQVSRMQARELLVRQKVGNGVEIHLAPAGWAMVERAQPIHGAAVRRYLIEPFTPAQISQLREVLARISRDGERGADTGVPGDRA